MDPRQSGDAVTRSRIPVNRNKVPGYKWTAVRPERREKHPAMVGWVLDGDGNPTDHLEIEAVVTGAVRVRHWRELEDPHAWRIGWV